MTDESQVPASAGTNTFEQARRTQAQAAIKQAHAVRRQRGELRKMLKAGELDGMEIIRGHTNPVIAGVVDKMKLRELLPMIPGIGKPRSLDICVAFDASTETRLGKLSPERRVELSLLVRGAREAYVGPRTREQVPHP